MKRFFGCLLLALCHALAQGCGAGNQALDAKEFQDERANPYSFNRSVAYTLLRTNQPLEASRVVRRMLVVEPKSAEAYSMLGQAYLNLKQYKMAERALRASLKLDAELAQTHSLLGVLSDTVGRHREAQEWHLASIRLDPDNADYRNNLGFSLYLDGKYRRAIRAYRASLERDLTLQRVHNNLGFAYARLGNLAMAQEHFSLAGPPAQATNNLGVIYESRGEALQAYEYFYLAVQQDPLLLPARKNLERVCARLGRPVPEVAVPEKAQGEPLPPATASATAAVSPKVRLDEEMEVAE